MSSQTRNEKLKLHKAKLSCSIIKNFEFLVYERVHVNPDNVRTKSALIVYPIFNLSKQHTEGETSVKHFGLKIKMYMLIKCKRWENCFN